MNTHNEYISYWLRRFLLEYATTVRNLSKNTLLSYRDTFKLLLPYLSKVNKLGIEKLSVSFLTRSNVQGFLKNLELSRNVSPASRNQRLTSILAFAKYLSTYNPEYAELYRELKLIPMKKHPKPMIGYLEKDEMEALLEAPDKTTQYGYRDYVIILFMYLTVGTFPKRAPACFVTLSMQYNCRCGIVIIGNGQFGYFIHSGSRIIHEQDNNKTCS